MNHHPPEISGHKYYDPKKLRVILPIDKVKQLPIKKVTSDELNELMNQWTFNPDYSYKNSIGKNVVGHDSEFRYIEVS